jgi:DNA-binding GntR family transcriptional regulator
MACQQFYGKEGVRMPELSENLPLYYKVVSDLLNKIKSGEISENSMLTPEIDLAQEYRVSRNTIRHAIGLLARDGYLMRIPGKGTFVLNPTNNLTRNQWAVSSIEDMLEITKQSAVDFAPMDLLETPPPFVLEDLQLQKWNKVCLFRGKKYQKKQLVSFLEVYLPYEIGVQIDEKERGQSTHFLYIQEKLGIEISQVDQYMKIEQCTEEDSRTLKCKVGAPKVVIKRIYSSEGHPVELSMNHYQSDLFSWYYRILRTR